MQDFDIEISGSRDELADVLTDVADGLRTGSVRLGEGEDAVAVEFPPELDLEIELESADGETSLELELEWPASEAADVADADSAPSVPESPDTDHTETDDSDAVDSSVDGGGDSRSTPGDATVEGELAPSDGSQVVGVPAGRQSLARFEVFQDRRSEWRWRLRHRNGNVIATSGEGYTQKHNARKGLRSVIANAPGAELTDESS